MLEFTESRSLATVRNRRGRARDDSFLVVPQPAKPVLLVLRSALKELNDLVVDRGQIKRVSCVARSVAVRAPAGSSAIDALAYQRFSATATLHTNSVTCNVTCLASATATATRRHDAQYDSLIVFAQ